MGNFNNVKKQHTNSEQKQVPTDKQVQHSSQFHQEFDQLVYSPAGLCQCQKCMIQVKCKQKLIEKKGSSN